MSYMLHFHFVLLGIVQFSLSRDGGMSKQVFVLSTISKKYDGKGNMKTFAGCSGAAFPLCVHLPLLVFTITPHRISKSRLVKITFSFKFQLSRCLETCTESICLSRGLAWAG